MKKLIILLTLAVFTLSTATSASAQSPAKKMKTKNSIQDKVKRAVDKNIIFPLFPKKVPSGTVDVSFVIDEKGNVEILSINSTNDRLEVYVKEKLSNIQLVNSKGDSETMHYRFTFKQEA